MIVLLAEDERNLAALIIDYLAAEGIECDYADNGKMALHLVEVNHYDALILDIEMPYLDGFAVCSKLSALAHPPAVMFISARTHLDDKLTAFSLGALDYLTKPFELAELVARLKIITHSLIPQTPRIFKLDSLHIDFNLRLVMRGHRSLTLSPKQWQLLTLLAHNSPEIVKKQVILAHLWPDQDANPDMYKTLLNRLRKNIDHLDEKALFKTIRGIGVALR
ncbi:response regulator transcription factor [Pseudoalteromonas tunicata]|uniref:response regulator transcription factor n=1 Tax=Pseudoalteromonas tunicata TaxID=314281 RepID=UPI00273F72A7|nr:response regulator transcription factor [Pseudoalteromonas tunicata]MDP5212651.1 response regulator transcription factor [Pseudoalteromonas tunicata]